MSFYSIAAVVFAVAGLFGSMTPFVPGAIMGAIGLALIYMRDITYDVSAGLTPDLVWLSCPIAVLISYLGKIFPWLRSRWLVDRRYATRGAFVGIVLGMVWPPVCPFIGGLVFSFLSYYYLHDKANRKVFRYSWKALVGVMFTSVVNMAGAATGLYYILYYI